MARIRPAYVFLAIALVLSFVNPLASLAAGYNRETSVVAGSVYGSYRVINRMAAMIAEAQVEVGVGASVTFSPGRSLQSLLDTLDRFGDIMFPLMILSGVLSVVIVPLAKLGAIVAALGLAAHIVAGRAKRAGRRFRSRASVLALGVANLGLLIALVIPAAYGAGYALGESITAPSWNRAVAAFEAFASDLAEAEPDVSAVVEPEPLEEAPEAVPPADASGGEDQGFFSGVMEGIASGAGAVAGATSSAIGATTGAVGGALTGIGSGIGAFGGQAWGMISSLPEFASRIGEIVSAALEFLIAYLVKTIVIPLAITALAVWFWRKADLAISLMVEDTEKDISLPRETF